MARNDGCNCVLNVPSSSPPEETTDEDQQAETGQTSDDVIVEGLTPRIAQGLRQILDLPKKDVLRKEVGMLDMASLAMGVFHR